MTVASPLLIIGALMPDFSAFIPETHRNVSSGYVETLIQARREELFTGLMRLSYPSGENLGFTFLEGVQQKLYRFFEDTVDVIPRQIWSDTLDHSSISVGFLRLSVEAMRFTRIVCEAPVVRVERLTLAPGGLIDTARKWSVEPEPGIVHVQSEVINKYYLIAGHSTPVVEELSFAEGGVRFSLSDGSFSQTLPQTTYVVTRYVSNRDHETWHEHGLRLAFNPFLRMLLNRFGELAGRALTGRLCERLSIWAGENGWNVAISSNGIVNRQYFETLESAVGFYIELIRRFQSEASPALGARMIDGIARDVLIKLDPYRRELLTRHIYSQSGVGAIIGVS
ncbi:MAG: hypothetical protein EHM33_15600 [Chloroflexi bacterium]|nr:MAG: hypothetical protein EHM33_15600 [Chloroflexota bacterium]